MPSTRTYGTLKERMGGQECRSRLLTRKKVRSHAILGKTLVCFLIIDSF